MNWIERFRRAALTVLVCLLALGILTLAHRAKCSQYQSVHTTGYLAKSVKMTGDRCQSAAVVPRVATLFSPFDARTYESLFVPDATQLPRSPQLQTLHSRPPPKF